MSTPSSPADFELIQRVLSEMKDKGRSPSGDKWVTEPRRKLDEYRAAGGVKVKKECDAVERGLTRAAELIELLRQAQVKR
jgi:hypothetical protein